MRSILTAWSLLGESKKTILERAGSLGPLRETTSSSSLEKFATVSPKPRRIQEIPLSVTRLTQGRDLILALLEFFGTRVWLEEA
jgi:hypothetical protein